jgi:hypothetical protein
MILSDGTKATKLRSIVSESICPRKLVLHVRNIRDHLLREKLFDKH